MPPISEVKTVFTVDLKPFALGLQTMLTMTQAAGKQIAPVLNLQAKPDFRVFDEQLKGLTKTVDDYLAAQVESVKTATTQTGATDALGAKTEEFEKKTRRARDAVDKKSVSLRHMKREALESFGAISFLVMNIVQLASQASGGSKELEKLSRGLSQGITAGFGLASIIRMLVPTMGTLGIVIGAVVAVGTALLSFLDRSEEKAKRSAKAMEMFTSSLKGASMKDLEQYRAGLLAIIKTADQEIQDLERRHDDALLQGATRTAGMLKEEHRQATERRKIHVEELQKLDEAMSGMQMTEGEVRQKIRQLEIEGEQNKYRRMKLEADKWLEDEKTKITESQANEQIKKQAVLEAEKVYQVKLKEIRDQEKKEREDKQREIEEKERKHHKRVSSLVAEQAKIILDIEEQKQLLTAKTEIERLAIQERFALARLEVDKNERLALAESEDERTAILRKAEVDRAKIRASTGVQVEKLRIEMPTGSIAAQQEAVRKAQENLNRARADEDRKGARARLTVEQDTLDRMTMSNAEYLQKLRDQEEGKRRQWMKTHQFAVTLIDGMTAGFSEMFGQMLIRQRQAKDEWDAAWLAMRNTVLQTLAQIITEAIKNAIIGDAAAAASAVVTNAAMAAIIPAATMAATMVSVATFGGAAAAGGGALAGTLAMMQALANATILGFEKGGKTKRGQSGFIEGFLPEIIAPEKDFYHIARTEMIPRMLIEQDRLLQVKINTKIREFSEKSAGAGNSELVNAIKDLRDRLDNLEVKVSGELIGEGRTLKAVIREDDRFSSRVGVE